MWLPYYRSGSCLQFINQVLLGLPTQQLLFWQRPLNDIRISGNCIYIIPVSLGKVSCSQASERQAGKAMICLSKSKWQGYMIVLKPLLKMQIALINIQEINRGKTDIKIESNG